MAYFAALPNVFLLPPVLRYYPCPETLEDVEKQIVGKILSRFEINTVSNRRWN